MGLIAKPGATSEQAPVGTHVAVCVQIIDIGTQVSDFYKNAKKQVLFGFELVNEKNSKGENFLIWRRYTNSTYETSGLRATIEAWRGKRLTEQEAESFELRKLLGQPCLVNCATSKDGKWTNVTGIMSLPKGQPKPIAEHEKFTFDIDDWDQRRFETFSDKFKQTIMASPEAKARFAGQRQTRATQEMPDYIPEQADNVEAGYDINDPPF